MAADVTSPQEARQLACRLIHPYDVHANMLTLASFHYILYNKPEKQANASELLFPVRLCRDTVSCSQS